MREKSKREVSRDVLSFSLINDAGVIKCNWSIAFLEGFDIKGMLIVLSEMKFRGKRN
jgi:hypothetical protein